MEPQAGIIGESKVLAASQRFRLSTVCQQYVRLIWSLWSIITRVAGWLAFIDLALALLPITIMWNLQLSLKSKSGISAIMGLGVLYGIQEQAVSKRPVTSDALSVVPAYVLLSKRQSVKASKLPELNARADITCKSMCIPGDGRIKH